MKCFNIVSDKTNSLCFIIVKHNIYIKILYESRKHI